jgi:oligopeptidase B
LRAERTNNRHLLLKINMVAGHQGASGRYRAYREIALDYAFLLDLAGITQ